jgi:hypothetical protein
MTDWWDHVVCASAPADGNINISSPPATLDGVLPGMNARILLKHQTPTLSQNTTWIFKGAGNPLQATPDVPASRSSLRVDLGNTQAKTQWSLIDTTNYVWAQQNVSVSVRDFGAKGNGTTDDAAAVTAALASMSPGGTLFFPPGTYIVGSSITIGLDNISVVGVAGASILKAKSSATYQDVLYGSGRTGLLIRDLIVDADGANRPIASNVLECVRMDSCVDLRLENLVAQNARGTQDANHPGTYLSGVGIAISAVNGLRITHVTTKNCGQAPYIADGMYISGTRIMVAGYTATSCLDHGIAFEKASQVTASNIVCMDCGTGIGVSNTSAGDAGNVTISDFVVGGTSASMSLGVDIGLFGSPLGTGNLNNVRLSNGQIDNRTSNGFPAVGVYPLSPPSTVSVSGASNTSLIQITTSAPHGYVTGQIVTIFGVRGNTGANGQFKVTFVDATNFTIADLGGAPVSGTGAYLGGGFTQPWGRVRGLTLQNINVAGSPIQAINISNADDVTIIGGDVVSAGAPILVQKYCTGVRVRGVRARSATVHSIYFDDGCSNIEVEGCRIEGKDGTTQWGIYCEGTCYDVRTAGNTVTGSSLLDPAGIGGNVATAPRSPSELSFRSTVPAAANLGNWPLGHTIINTAGAAAGPLGWQVTTAGTAGAGAVFTPLAYVDLASTQAAIAGSKTWTGSARFNGYVGVNGAPPAVARMKVYGDASKGAVALQQSGGTTTGLLFDDTGNYGYLDYDATTGNGVRLSALGPVRIGQNTNAAYGSSTFTEYLRLSSAGVRLLTVSDISADVASTWKTSSGGLTLSGFSGLTLKVNAAARLTADAAGTSLNGNFVEVDGQLSSATNTVAYASTTTFDFNNGNVQKVTLTSSVIFAFSNLRSGAIYTLIIVQGAVNSTATWPGTAKFVGSDATLSTALNAVDVYQGVCDGTNIYFNAVKKGF